MNTGSPITPITSRCSAAGSALAGLECDMLRLRILRQAACVFRAAEGSFESGISCRDYASAAGSGWTGDWPRSRRQVTSWKLTAYAPKPVIHAALLAHDGYGTGIPISSFRKRGRGGSA